MRYYAMLSAQGTVCLETVLNEAEFNSPLRQKTESQCCTVGVMDPPIAGSWVDVTHNDAVQDMLADDE